MVFSSLSGYLINLGAHLMVNYSQGSAKTPAEDSPAAMDIETPVANQTLHLTSNALDTFVDRWAQQAKGKGKKKRKGIRVIKYGPKAKAEAEAAKKAKTEKDSSKVFDKAWFKNGTPKYYGRVTVYIDRRARKYRIKPEPGMRYNWCITWSSTDEKQQSQ